jgi:hypothetical protein
MPTHERATGPGPRPDDDPSGTGTEAQEQDPTLGPGTTPDAERDDAPGEPTPGGRP